ncbi:oxidoreductase, aryl-alcohol dehydrogenase like protein [Halogeometricum borinquense DSM 11551]|uniref:Oxidoreductase, aryl-alcohol dehydrogenase like protein n=1 Tax=Halogeometricum borinquense (strain ATCC 700274 / DSM 11551 / JCM 10706 / KCTC 4070 / PR3) TaxID=469382 RepID=E4NQ05_HALBP|nr:aldo/keto reductase [Halogeometricum borinquense]ADQ67750.1 predicted oxidoreductase, aryl-alcohol dehydrogenase like protein [Halogeometricum borinquense DSM 11551]ELY23568.1 oxidoreductase, aryl-alcohol dehydrogenase like protein [Halogeometricum borinquense DSM 11551]
MTLDSRRLGSTGTKVSELCFGTWRFGRETNGVLETSKEEAHDLLDAFADRGGNFIDSANVYGTPNGRSESWIGDWLAERDRENYVITSKVYFPFDEENPNGSGLSRTHIRDQIEGTLDRLGTEYLDLYYIHRWDEETPIEETLSTLNRLVEEGKVNYLGASTMAAWQLTKALWKSEVHEWERFEVTQPLFHAGYYEDVKDYLDVCGDQELAVCPYSPLAGGFLTGKYERADPDDPTQVIAPDGSRASFDDRFEQFYLSERGWNVLDTIRTVADEVDASPAQVALRWLMDYPEATVIPIVGARTEEQLDENVEAADVSLSEDQWERIMNARYDDEGRLWGH